MYFLFTETKLRKNGCDKLFKDAVDSNDEHAVAVQWRITVAYFRIFTDGRQMLAGKTDTLVQFVNC